MKLRSHKRGVSPDILVNPLFVVSVGVLVTIITLLAIRNLGSMTEFEKQFYATDLGTHSDSLYAVRPGVNYQVKYLASTKFGYLLEPKKVIVYEKKREDGKAFYYTEDPEFAFVYGEYKPEREDPYLHFYRMGRQLGVLKGEPNLAMPYCESHPPAKLTATINHQSIQKLGQEPIQLSTGNLEVYANAHTGEPILKIYTNENPESENIACELAVKIFEENPSLEGYAVIPVNKDFISRDDPRLKITQTRSPAVYVDIGLPSITPQVQAQTGQAMIMVVNDHVV